MEAIAWLCFAVLAAPAVVLTMLGTWWVAAWVADRLTDKLLG
jgi:hypothetical protein